MKSVKLLGMEIKKEKKGELSYANFDTAYYVKRMHDVCGDSAFIELDRDKAVLAVLDGVSGEQGAEQASSVAAIALMNHLKGIRKPTRDDLQEALVSAHSHITNGLTTALLVVVQKNGDFIVASVGDSLLYSIDREGEIKLQVQPMRLVGEGSPAFRYMMYRNMVESALGLPTDMNIFFRQGNLDKDDVLLLLTDGVTDNLLVIVEDKTIKDASGINDLEAIIGKADKPKTIVRKIRSTTQKRMEDRYTEKGEGTLFIKPDDYAIICFSLKRKSRT